MDQAERPVTSDISAPTDTGPHVVIVDDDATIRHLHRAILERAGFRITAVDGGAAALEVVGNAPVDLMLLDSSMPGMTGIEVLNELRASESTLPVILVTGAGDMDDRVRGLRSGADDYIVKPVDARELVARVEALFRGRQAAIDGATGSRAADAATRAEITSVLETRAYHPVFQPIVALADRSVVAYEALTRFDDGTRPDLRFTAAERVGLGPQLALATLRASVEAAHRLPAGIALSLNVSPQLLAHGSLAEVLVGAGRPVIVELTEHDPIDDYAQVLRQLDELGDDVLLAIDDAGAGYSSMTHILALDPHEVKLDREWVKGVDTDVARRALIAGFVSFAVATDTLLVAEGVETEGEAATLTELGVMCAQGYHFGRPEPV